MGYEGHSIADGDRDRIFERFGRLQPARDRRTGGAGLGLAITRSIVEGHGGTVRAEGREGGGARVVMEVPAAFPGARAVTPG